MKNFMTRVLAISIVSLSFAGAAFATDKADKEVSPKVKAANEAHSDAPATMPEGASTGSPAAGHLATGEGLQGLPSPEMTKFISQMKKCHKKNKTDQGCHDGVMKKCEAKLTKEECGQIMSAIHTDKKHKM